jgi:hypothetical protein
MDANERERGQEIIFGDRKPWVVRKQRLGTTVKEDRSCFLNSRPFALFAGNQSNAKKRQSAHLVSYPKQRRFPNRRCL